MKRTALRPSRGTQIPQDVRAAVSDRDGRRCIGPLVGMPGECDGPLDLDHVRASGGLGLKSPSTVENLVTLCRFVHHDLKTREGRTWRPQLIDYVDWMARLSRRRRGLS